MGENNELFENFERNKYLKKLPSMKRVKLQHVYSDYRVPCIWSLKTGLTVF